MLRALALHGAELGEEGARALASSPILNGLTGLSYDGGPELGLLLDSSPFASINSLTIAPSRDAAVGLASARRLGSIGSLEVLYAEQSDRARGIGPDGARAIAGSPLFSELRVLVIGGANRLGEVGGAAIVFAPFASTLEELSITGHGYGSPRRRRSQ
jgi:hypothetical protein